MAHELPSCRAGSLVRVRGDAWRVEDVARYEDCSVCRLSGIGPSNRGRQRAVLLPFDRPTLIPRRDHPARVGRRRWMRALGASLLQATPAGGLRAAAPGRLDLLAYQLEPALACVAGESRILLADEVGLGKTVQAGLVLAELFVRRRAARGLVLAPASLCEQWVAELQDRFGLDPVHVNAASLARLVALSAPGANPWHAAPVAVASFDYVKQPEVLAGVMGVRWDALVVDEAHMVALARDRSKAVRRIACSSSHVLLLTATPHAGDTDGFRALCNIGRLPGEPPVAMFRRTRSSLAMRRTRRVLVLPVTLSDVERVLHEELERYTSLVWNESSRTGSRAGARLAMIVLRKRAASGPAALQASLARRLEWLSGCAEAAPARQLPLPLDGEDEPAAADEEPSSVLFAAGLTDREAECLMLARLSALAQAASVSDTKAHALTRLLRRAAQPAIVFTEYRDTLARLASRLEPLGTLSVLHGGLGHDDRRKAVADFVSGRSRLLLATDAAAHGLNLQRTCRLVVNVELPWVPARLEQRIGRVDRIGQQRAVHAVHLVARRTAEELVLARLVLRIERERDGLGEADDPLGALREMDVARAAFDGLPPRPLPTGEGPARRCSLRPAACAERERLVRLRLLVDSGCGRGVPGPEARASCWTVLRRRGRLAAMPPGLACIFTARLVDGRGALVEEWVFALHLAAGVPLAARRTLVRGLPALLALCTPGLQRRADLIARQRLRELCALEPERLAGAVAREAAIAASEDRSEGAIQQGLFDRRAVKQADEARRRRRGDEVESNRRLDEWKRAARVRLAGRPELTLVLGLAD